MLVAERRFVPGPTFADDDWFHDRLPSDAILAEARGLVAAFDVVLAPAAPQLVRGWLKPLAGAVANPPGEFDFDARAAALITACATMPVVAFTSATLREAIWRFKFWPSASDLLALLQEEADRYQARRRDVLKVASVRPIAELEEARRLHDERCRRDGTGRYPSDRRQAQVDLDPDQDRWSRVSESNPTGRRPTPMSGGL